ncbi:MAG TPA: cupin domain-containing protein [Rubellimicrobium sp.]|nr:cupin domain-containing protein [Rubellimicrobium sp.]
MTDAERIIERLELEPHPEGGWYRQTWAATAPPGERPAGTCIFFLLKSGERSHWHRVEDADEVWHFYAGAPLMLRVAEKPKGPAFEIRLGTDILGRQTPQAVVPAGWWQSAYFMGEWTLVGCTVSPGFTFGSLVIASPGFDIPRAP